MFPRLINIRPLIAAIGLSAAAAPLSALAAGTQTGQVTKLQTRASDNLVYFYLTGTPNGRPACATNPYWMIKDETSDTGKRQFAMLMAAYVSGRSVTVHGAGTCTRWGTARMWTTSSCRSANSQPRLPCLSSHANSA